MAYRSWLQDVRDVRKLGSHIWLTDKDWSLEDKREEQGLQKWRQRKLKPLPVPPDSAPFFGGALHDSWVTAAERQGDQLRVTIHNDFAESFAHVYCRLKQIPNPNILYPIELVFEGVEYVNAARNLPSGVLRWADWRSWTPPLGGRGDQLICDWFEEESNRLQWICNIHAVRTGVGALGSDLYLMVDCERAFAIDLRRKPLADAFGEELGLWWDEAIATLGQGYELWSSYEAFLEGKLANSL